MIIYPNPSNTHLIVSIEREKINSLTVYNQLGQIIFSKDNIDVNQYDLITDQWDNGQYILRVDNKEHSYYKSLLIIH